MNLTCMCGDSVREHRVTADEDGPLGSCKLCTCQGYVRATDKPYIPRYTREEK